MFCQLISFIHLQELEAYLSPDHYRDIARGNQVLTLPLILYSDDMSGNRSKKWHEFNNWCLLLAGLPRHLNTEVSNIHLISFSDSVSTLDMAAPIAEELLHLETLGIDLFDTHLNQEIHVIAPLLLCICDNPRASELLNHRGSTARKPCRMCLVSPYVITYAQLVTVCACILVKVWVLLCSTPIQVDRDHNTAVLSTPRTKSLSLQQIANIQEKRTETDKKELRVEYGLSEHHNPLFNIPADLYRYKIYVYRIAMIT